MGGVFAHSASIQRRAPHHTELPYLGSKKRIRQAVKNLPDKDSTITHSKNRI
ncbi:MAG: hypothetical protein H6Q31_1763 [Bacteroidetes bacterium]|nr:hypothetical protein [Bacteroidota bacterium]